MFVLFHSFYFVLTQFKIDKVYEEVKIAAQKVENVYLRCELDRRMIFSRNVFCGATKPLRPPGIFVNYVQSRCIQHTGYREYRNGSFTDRCRSQMHVY